MASQKLTVTTALSRIEMPEASVVVIKNDGASNIFFDFDIDATNTTAELQSGDSIAFDLGANNKRVYFLSIVSALSSTVRVWWV